MYSKGRSGPGGISPGNGIHSHPSAEGSGASVRHSSSGHPHRRGHYLQAPGPSQALHSPRAHSQGFPHVMHRHHRSRHWGKVKYVWAMIGGLALFLGLFFLLFPSGHGDTARVEHLTGHLLIWPGLLLALSGLFSLAVAFGFRLGTDPVTRETALRHYVGRKLIKLGLVSAMFWGGWLLGLFVALILSLGHA